MVATLAFNELRMEKQIPKFFGSVQFFLTFYSIPNIIPGIITFSILKFWSS